MEEHAVASSPRECERCGGSIAWEALREGQDERWLGLCDECGWMTVFLPGQPQCTPRDPLRVFLLGTGTSSRPESRPWIRLFRMTGRPPWNVDWHHCPLPCGGCGSQVVFQVHGYPRPHVIARSLLCLACGHASVEHIRPGTTLREMPAVGDVWSPPCPAVARLRDALLRPFWRNQEEMESEGLTGDD